MTDEHGPDIPDQRQYLPTLSDLLDRLSIVLMKSIFISEYHHEYAAEIKLIKHDIDLLILKSKVPVGAEIFYAVMVLMLANRVIWENESKARQGGNKQDKLLKLTHSINGVRSRAKNIIAIIFRDRVDLKIDSFAAELTKEFGNWNVWNDA